MAFMRSISHFNWQVLRVAARSKKPLTGRALRFTPTAKTRNGKFLNILVECGLLEVVSVEPAKKGSKEESDAEQFRTLYKLTDKGKHAAEYGEYEEDRQVKDLVQNKPAST